MAVEAHLLRRGDLCRQRGATLAAMLKLARQPLGPAFRAFAAVRTPKELTRTVRIGRPPAHAHIVGLALLDEGRHALMGFQTRIVNRQPVAGVSRRGMPGQLLPEIHLRLGVPRTLEELVDDLVAQVHDDFVHA